MRTRPDSWPVVLLAVLALASAAGCSTSGKKAPVEDRGAAVRPSSPAPTPPAPAAPAAATPSPAADDAVKAGFYTVRPGDTLLRIALEHGQNWRDLARWNNLDNPNVIEVGQVLRVRAPSLDSGSATTQAVAGAGRVESRPLDARPATAPAAPSTATPAAPSTATSTAPATAATLPAAAAAATPAPATAPATTVSAATAAPPVPPPVSTADAADQPTWVWPAAGPVLAGFDEGRNKGLTIGGKAGDPVLAAADGRVVYAGSSLRGYGNLVIVKHSELFLTAYAHNQTLLVKEDQAVRRGQRIADMGSSDAERVQLHFEIRRQGKPVDPARLLPAR